MAEWNFKFRIPSTSRFQTTVIHMRIISYKYSDSTWAYSQANLKRINLIVGSTGSGKTKFLNTIFNLGRFIRQNTEGKFGKWNIKFALGKKEYEYDFEASETDSLPVIRFERLALNEGGKSKPKELVLRTPDSFLLNGQELPKLSQSASAIFLLKDEPVIKPVSEGFGRIIRRSFFSSVLDKAIALPVISSANLKNVFNEVSRSKVYAVELPLALQLFMIKENTPSLFKELVDQFCSVFPHIRSLDVTSKLDANPALSAHGYSIVVEFKERGVKQPIPLIDISSGMQKVLLIMADILLIPDETIYMIDEYENSLGINAINFLPGFISEYAKKSQILITTHHPYLINKIPVKNWMVFSRSGAKVTIKDGAELETKYKSSKQEAFVQLINDPLYYEGPK
ncbi:MAG: ATP-binding protein [Rhodocyclaceae bacterium]|nr:ATP-binding protein [Rhodocyclaceae bacterium]